MGLEIVAEMIAGIGAAARDAAADLKQAASEAKTFAAELESARDTTAGISSGTGGTTPKSLGAAIQAQTGRR